MPMVLPTIFFLRLSPLLPLLLGGGKIARGVTAIECASSLPRYSLAKDKAFSLLYELFGV
jgi:hypothetical protein